MKVSALCVAFLLVASQLVACHTITKSGDQIEAHSGESRVVKDKEGKPYRVETISSKDEGAIENPRITFLDKILVVSFEQKLPSGEWYKSQYTFIMDGRSNRWGVNSLTSNTETDSNTNGFHLFAAAEELEIITAEGSVTYDPTLKDISCGTVRLSVAGFVSQEIATFKIVR